MPSPSQGIPHYIPQELWGKVEPTYATCPPELAEILIPKPIIRAKTAAGATGEHVDRPRSFVTVNNPGVVAWVEQRTGATFAAPLVSFGFFKRGRIAAGIVLHGWTKFDVEMSASILPGGISRRDLRHLADYIFRREDQRRVTMIIPVTNDKARRIAERLGFELECIRKDYCPEGDGAMYRLLKSDCRWF